MKTTTSLIAALLAATATPALAQSAAETQGTGPVTAPEETTSTALADIIVTAQKRSERLQDVPIAVTVISGEAIAASGAVNIENAQYLVPTLNFRKSGSAINQSLFLRGVGTSTFSIAGEPSVSTVVDGVVFSRAGEAFSDLIDIERIEVLRGPQGTLFGKNASAGVVNVVTKRPGDTLGGYVEGGFFTGNGNEYRTRVALDLPLGPVKSRVTGFYGTYAGNIRNVTRGTRVNGYEHYGVRGVFVIDPTPDVTVTLIGDYRESDDDCCGEVIGTVPAGLAGAALPTPRGDRTRRLAQDLITRTTEKSWGGSAQIEATVAGQTVTSITSYREYDNREIRDGDFLPRAFADQLQVTQTPAVPGRQNLNQLHDDGPQVSDTFTQEVRITSPGNQFLTYTVGAFYSRAFTERTFTRRDVACDANPRPAILVPCGTPGAPPSTFPIGSANFGSLFKNLAFYGQGELNLTERLRLIGGVRYTNDELSVFHQRVTTLAGPGINPSFGPFRGKTTNDNWSGKAGAQFDIAPAVTAYGSWTRGYKGPAFNVFFNLGATGTNVIEPETSDSYEGGLKTTFLDGRLVLNVAGYYAKYNNFQANNPDVVAGVLVTRFTNAGEISTRGGELDLLFRPVPDFNISGGVAYTDAKVDAFRVPTNGVTTGVIPPGTRLGYAPKWKGSLAADYRLRTGGAVDFGLGADASYQSSQLAQFDANPAVRAATTIGSYGLVNLAASLIERDDRFKLTAQVRNLFNESFAASITSGGPGGSFRYIIPREADRYYGITGRVNF
ncbi:TonB-dependent receptor [uncultured Sphingomonas sp.]|uniref:TonB-dependent receptor n=1 Tax=uncultured Sphingomonas sp. TaxID=158754 RepID=UPI0035CBF68B